MAPIKILACGSVNGNFLKFFKKISTVNKKNGPFEMVVCCGNFFPSDSQGMDKWKQFLLSKTKVDVPVYILGPCSKQQEVFFDKEKLKDGEELYENLLYLGEKGVFNTASGLSVAYISGDEKYDAAFQSKTKALKEQVLREDEFVGVDILLTSAWPQGVNTYTSSKISGESESASVSLLAGALKPRYHLCCHSNYFYERLPYRNHMVLRGTQEHATRFLALAPFANKNNEKAIYAFSLQPLRHINREDLVKQPSNTTEFPYKNITISNLEEQKSQQFFYKEDNKRKQEMSDDRTNKVAKGPRSVFRRPQAPTSNQQIGDLIYAAKLSGDCWFCLGGKDVEKHLVVSVGEKTYVTTAKGALNEDHVLVMPVEHHNSTAVLPHEVLMELEKYKNGLRKMFASENKAMVTFERNFYTQHLQLQVVGITEELADDIKDVFIDLGMEACMDFIEMEEGKDLTELVAVTTPYFAVELPSGERLLHKVKGRMPLQFGREVLASPSLLNMEGRVDWKVCKLSKENETEAAKLFRKRFQAFDFNFEE